MAAKRSPLASVMRLGHVVEEDELDQLIDALKEIKRFRFGAFRKARKANVKQHTPKAPDEAAS